MSEIVRAKIHGMGHEIKPYLAGLIQRLYEDQEYSLEIELYEIFDDSDLA